jgi:hypothetical protein
MNFALLTSVTGEANIFLYVTIGVLFLFIQSIDLDSNANGLTSNGTSHQKPVSFTANGTLNNYTIGLTRSPNGSSTVELPRIDGTWNLTINDSKVKSFAAMFVILSVKDNQIHGYTLNTSQNTPSVSKSLLQSSTANMSTANSTESLPGNNTQRFVAIANLERDDNETLSEIPITISILFDKQLIEIASANFKYQPIVGPILSLSNLTKVENATLTSEEPILQSNENMSGNASTPLTSSIESTSSTVIDQVPKTQPSSFLTYDNPDYGISILYPSNWTKSEENLQSHQVVSFYAPKVNVMNQIISPAHLSMTIEPINETSTPIGDYSDQFLSKVYPNPSDLKILNTSMTTLSGHEAQKTVMLDFLNGQTSKELRVFSIIDGNVYRLGYFAQPGTFLTHLPLIDRMIDSFNVTLAKEPTSDTIISNGSAAIENVINPDTSQTPVDNNGSNCMELQVVNIEASGFETDPKDYHPPKHAVDNDPSTRWSNLGIPSWIKMDLGTKKTVCNLDISWNKGDERKYSFQLASSNDDKSFTDIYSGSSSGKTLDPEQYDIPDTKSRYLKLTLTDSGSKKGWVSISEITFNR